MTLADPDQPLVGEDGTLVTPITRVSSPVGVTFVPSNREMQANSVKVRKQLADLPLPAKQMNIISVICMYTMIGLSDNDISIATGLPEARIEAIKMLDAYMEVYKAATSSILSDETDDIRAYVTKHAKNAAEKMVDLMTSENDFVKMTAAKDILDRSGNRPVDVIEHHHRLDGELRIAHIRSDDLKNVEIDLNAEEVNSSS